MPAAVSHGLDARVYSPVARQENVSTLRRLPFLSALQAAGRCHEVSGELTQGAHSFPKGKGENRTDDSRPAFGEILPVRHREYSKKNHRIYLHLMMYTVSYGNEKDTAAGAGRGAKATINSRSSHRGKRRRARKALGEAQPARIVLRSSGDHSTTGARERITRQERARRRVQPTTDPDQAFA